MIPLTILSLLATSPILPNHDSERDLLDDRPISEPIFPIMESNLLADTFYVSTDDPNVWIEVRDEDIGITEDYYCPPHYDEVIQEILS